LRKATQIPRLMAGSRMNIGLLIALAGSAVLWLFLFRSRAGFAQQVSGWHRLRRATPAFRRAVRCGRRCWFRVVPPGWRARWRWQGRLASSRPMCPAGYGFAAIIVAFVGRLHPVGMVLSAILMSMFYIGGELAQSRLGLPKSLTGVFQGLLLFTLLACDTLIAYRVRWVRAAARRQEADMESYALLIGSTLSAGTVLAIAALGLLINEKAGIVNLGAEGMMLCAAIAGFATVVHTGNTWLGFAAGMAGGGRCWRPSLAGW
jgi:ABC-type uncharacterized transport system permease subunit